MRRHSTPEIVGRADELAILRDAFEAGARGMPRAVIIRGEAGIGKTRLLDAFLARIEDQHHDLPLVVATGQCADLGAIGTPFAPLRRLLRELWEQVGDAVFRDAARTPAVIATLATLVPDLAPEGPAPSGEADYVAEAIERVVEALSAERHLLLVIEDLHWADAATLALLKTLAVTLRGRHATLVMTHRTSDLARGHPLRPVLAEFDRSRSVTSLELPRLGRDEIAAQMQGLTGTVPDDAAVARIAARSDGVPYFVEELIHLGAGPLPETLRDLVLARTQRLSSSARRIIGIAAAGGMRVDHALLATVAGADHDEDALREAIAEGVLVADGDGYAFRHALIQEAVHDELLAGERLDLHRRYAEQLQDRVDAGDSALAAEAAEQWLAARDDAAAFAATSIAMGDAGTELAPAAVSQLGERLLALWERMDDPERVAGTTHAALVERVAVAFAAVGQERRAVRLVDEALAHETEPIARAQLLVTVAPSRMEIGDDVLASLYEALALVEHLDERDALAIRSAALSLIANFADDELTFLDRVAMSRQAIELAERSGDDEALSRALRRGVHAAFDHRDLEDLIADLERAAQLATEPVGRGTARTNHIDVLVRLGRYRDAVAIGELAWEDAVAAGVERGVGSMVLANTAQALFALGDVEEGLRTVRRAERLVTSSFFDSFVLRQQALVACWNDRPDEADALIARQDDLFATVGKDEEELFGWLHVEIDRALLEAETATVERGDALVRGALASAAEALTEAHDESGSLRTSLLASAAWAVRAAGRSGARTEEVAAGLRRAVAALRSDGSDAAMAVHVAAHLADDEDAWRASIDAGELGTTPVHHLHHARFRLAALLVREGRKDEATPLLGRIAAEAPGHGAEIVARWARELAERAGIPRPGEDAAPARAAGLTPRELQVLALVAEGLTNPQIGTRLFISPKTASVHVSAILAKVGAANRAEAAAYFATLSAS